MRTLATLILTVLVGCQAVDLTLFDNPADQHAAGGPRAASNEITAFGVPGALSVTITSDAIEVVFPIAADLAKPRIPTVTHSGAGISPETGVALDFSKSLTYTVTAANQSVRTYTVKATLSTGMIITLAGPTPPVPTAGFLDLAPNTSHSATEARFNGPMAVVKTNSTDYVVLDTGNHRLRFVHLTPDTVANTASQMVFNYVDVTSMAGNGQPGFADGLGPVAQFNVPLGMTTDGAGILYVADTSNHRIRKVDTTTTPWTVTTLAGTGAPGKTDGDPTSVATFKSPSGIAYFKNASPARERLLVADTGNSSIRMIDLLNANTVETIAGLGTAGYSDTTAASSRFKNPFAIAVDAAGNLYVSDTGNTAVRKIDFDISANAYTNVTTLAGSPTAGTADGTGTLAQFLRPQGIAVDSTGYVYVSDATRIRQISSNGVVTTLAGTASEGYVDGKGTAARFGSVAGLFWDGTGLNLADSLYNVLRYLKPNNTVPLNSAVTPLAGGLAGSADGSGTMATFSTPGALAIDDTGNLYVADSFNSKIRKVSTDGTVSTLSGTGAWGHVEGVGTVAEFMDPVNLIMGPNGKLIVGEFAGQRIRTVSLDDGSTTTLAGTGSLGYFDSSKGTTAQVSGVRAFATDVANNIYFADRSDTIRKISTKGAVTTIAGVPNTPGVTNGPANAAQFNTILGLAVDSTGDIFVFEYGNNDIRKLTPDGSGSYTVSNFVGAATSDTTALDGVGSDAKICARGKMVIDGTGNLWVTDTVNHLIRRITPDGAVTTVAGGSRSPGWSDGPVSTARLNGPWGLAVDQLGVVYFCDQGTNLIRKLQ